VISRRLQFFSITAATISLLAGFVVVKSLPGLLLASLAAVCWSWGVLRNKRWVVQIGFILAGWMTAFAVIEGVSGLVALGVMLLYLAGWDLARFTPQVENIIPLQTAARVQSLHLRRLGWTLAAGAVTGCAASLFHFQLGFTAAMLIGLAAMVLLGLSMKELARSSREASENEK
jgi:hypothetical protein